MDMSSAAAAPLELRFDLAEIRRQTLRTMSLPLLLVAYFALGREFLLSSAFTWQFIPPALLAISVSASVALATSRLRLANTVFVTGVVAASLGTVLLQSPSASPYMGIVVVMVGVLLPPLWMAGVSTALAMGIMAIEIIEGVHPIPSGTAQTAIVVLTMTTLATWLSSRNLYTALGWAWESYVEAREERERALARQAELSRALKALDEAADRLQHMNYELGRARDVAEEMRGLQQQFMANVSHELRTPLALIVGFSEMLYLSPESYDTPLPQAFVADVREIYRNSQHLLSVIDDILDSSQLRAGKMRLRREMTRIGDVIMDAAAAVRPLIEGKGLTLDVEIDRLVDSGLIDPTRVRQILINLLNNARRFTTQGGVSVHARCPTEETVEVSVSDTGVGIPSEDHERLFQVFAQLDSSLGKVTNGVGLGLSISRDLVEMHGGRIWVESQGVPGKGSTFRFTLPLSQADDTPRPLLRRTPDTPIRRALSDQAMKSVLLVSPDEGAAATLARHLSQYEFASVKEPAGALPVLKARRPLAVVISPTSDHEDEQSKELEQLCGDMDVPIILCPFGREERLARSLGVQGYLVKPVSREQLFAALVALGEGIRRILIVDDDLRFVRLLSRIIRASGHSYDIRRAYNGEDALRLLESENIDLVLLDILMPGMSGYALLDRMRQNPSLASIPVIVITSRGYDLEDSRQLGGRIVQITHRWGLSNEQSLRYLDAILGVLVTKTSEAA
jgi:signal transduction histidine kinase/CheY-like chemotaxis protein